MGEKFKLDSKVVKIGLEVKDRDDALTKIGKMLENTGYVKTSYIQGILNRESIFPTGLPTEKYGIAIPHTDIEHVKQPMVSVVTLKNSVEFNIMGGGENDKIDVKIIFMLAMKDGNAQLQLLQNIMSIIQDEEILTKIYESKNEEQLLELVSERL